MTITIRGGLSIDASAPGFDLVATDGRRVRLEDFDGKQKLFYFLPSIDDDAHAAVVEKAARALDASEDAVLIPVSKDPPARWLRFLREHDIDGIAPLSAQPSDTTVDWGFEMQDGEAAGKLAPAFVVVDDEDIVVFVDVGTDVHAPPPLALPLKRLGVEWTL